MTTPFDPGDEPLTWHEEREHISEREQRVLDRLSRRAGIDMQSDRESLARWWDQLTAEQQAAAERASRHPEMADAILDAAQRARDGGPIEVPDRPLEREPSAAEWWPEVDQAEVTHDHPVRSADPRSDLERDARRREQPEERQATAEAEPPLFEPHPGRTRDRGRDRGRDDALGL